MPCCRERFVSPAAEAAYKVAQVMGGGVQHSAGDFRVRCPVHGGEDRHLSIKNGAKGADILVSCHSHECDRIAILRAIKDMGGRERVYHEQKRKLQPAVAATSATNSTLELAWTIWREGRSICGTLAQRYFAGRGLDLPPDIDCLRFHPRLRHPTGVEAPAVVGLVRDPTSSKPLGIHRTFLANDGSKTTLKPDRALLGGGGLGVVKLVDDPEVTQRLELAEGLESALAIMTSAARSGHMVPPIWAATCASAFAQLPVLPGVEVMVLHPDNDSHHRGQDAACRVIERWRKAGSACEFFVSTNPRGKDWNDTGVEAAA
jgi:putative DNA primase/helicase